MCAEVKRKINPNIFFGIAIVLGILTGYLQNSFLFLVADTISQLFINLLKLVSLPIIFLSIVSTASGMESLEQIKQIGRKVIKYTLLTTVTAATVALALFITIDPVKGNGALARGTEIVGASQPSYLSFFIKIVPSNIVQPFYENNVIGVLFFGNPLQSRSDLIACSASIRFTLFLLGSLRLNYHNCPLDCHDHASCNLGFYHPVYARPQ